MFFKLLSLVLGSVYVFLAVLLARGRFKISMVRSRIECGITVRLIGSGRIEAGALKTRGDVCLLSQGGVIRFGEGVFLNSGVSINALERVEIGSGTLIGNSVHIYDHDHRIDGVVYPKEFVSKPVSIGRNCWIGANVVILKGVTIVDNVVIGAGTVVAGDILESGIYVSKKAPLSKIREL